VTTGWSSALITLGAAALIIAVATVVGKLIQQQDRRRVTAAKSTAKFYGYQRFFGRPPLHLRPSSVLRALYESWPARLIILTTVLVAASDLPGGLLTSFWLHHAALVGLVTGALTLGIGAAVIGTIVRCIDTSRGHQVAAMAYEHLGQTTLQLMGRLIALAYPESMEGNFVIDDLLPQVQPALQEAVYSSPSASKNDELPQRFESLCANEGWLVIAKAAIALFQNSLRTTIGQWTGALLASSESAAALDRLASLDAFTVRLRDSFLRMAMQLRIQTQSADVGEEGRETENSHYKVEPSEIQADWELAILESCGLAEILLSSAGTSDWVTFAMPVALLGSRDEELMDDMQGYFILADKARESGDYKSILQLPVDTYIRRRRIASHQPPPGNRTNRYAALVQKMKKAVFSLRES
jgi:hypothetical protein